MIIRFWGVRGSLATAITARQVEEKIRKVLELATPADLLSKEAINNFISNLPFSVRGTYGGNTTCVELQTNDNRTIVIDAGTGLRALGNALMARGKMKGHDEMAFFFTHSHWDHIQGLMFFVPVFIPGNTLHFYSCFADIEARLRYQMVTTHFPLTFDELGCTKVFHHFTETESVEVYGLQVSAKSVRHPGGCYSYKFRQPNGKTFIFCSDAEFNLATMDDIGPYIDYFFGADILVFDTQYTFEESLQKIDWGHSSAAIATDIAIRSEVKKLVLYHHDPSYDDDKMDNVLLQAIKYKSMMAPRHPLQIVAAYEGLELEL
ncbi:MAG: MBL fold metallo-hydrolase [Turneriella sp.]|nr:MBL fold metallo-hydrolase [Leptospiraceae bacterium]MCX7633553.1 MBL fold metallo-hydrolase [Turneriella sp.]